MLCRIQKNSILFFVHVLLLRKKFQVYSSDRFIYFISTAMHYLLAHILSAHTLVVIFKKRALSIGVKGKPSRLCLLVISSDFI